MFLNQNKQGRREVHYLMNGMYACQHRIAKFRAINQFYKILQNINYITRYQLKINHFTLLMSYITDIYQFIDSIY